MALSKEKKSEVVTKVTELLNSSRMTVIAKYAGTPVKSMQQLRREASDSGTTIVVVKNRLVKKALADNSGFKDIDSGFLSGQLLYAFNSRDEAAAAQVLAAFAKNQPQIEFVAGLSSDGRLVSAAEVALLASLPSKDVLRAKLAGTIAAPLSGFVNVLSGNMRGFLNVLGARAQQLN